MSNHNLHPHGSQNGPNSHLSPPRTYSREEEMSKELQIKLMKEKLDFVTKQLEEKDRQLDHYKQLVKTLKDVLSEVSGNRKLLHSHSSVSFTPQQSVTNSNGSKVRPPPGFERTEKKNSLKGRRARSHQQLEFDEIVPREELEEWRQERREQEEREREKEQEMNRDPWRRPEKASLSPELNESSSNKNAFLQKSASHQGAFASLLHAEEVDEDEDDGPFPNRTLSPKPQNPSLSAMDKKNQKLKRSSSTGSVVSALEENRLESKFPELEQLIGQIYPLSKYQQGCRFLQKKLDEKNPTNTNIILSELFDHLVELLTDPFGNYLFSKLMEQCDGVQREKIIRKILPDIMTVAIDMYGTQSLQKMMPFLSEEQIEAVIETLKPNAISIIKHNKANYLIQYCLDHLPPKHNQWIYNAVYDNMEEISRDRVGCVIVKRCIDHATPEQKERLVNEITKKLISLVQDPFGNYVVQHVLDKFPKDPSSTIMVGTLLGNLNELCVQKFSSNVVEKCLHVADIAMRTALLREIAGSDMLPQLLNDRFANFVIQTALDVASPPEKQLLVKTILPHLGRHYSPFTKRLQKKILQMQQELNDYSAKGLSESPK